MTLLDRPRRVAVPWWPILLVALVYAALHLWQLRLPPLGHDSWRQCDVLSVGRNYCDEQTPFWLPRVDSRGATTGITGMEFPLLNWIEGRLACAGFDQVFVGRTISLLFTLLAIVCLGRLGAALPGKHVAWLSAAAFATSPLVWYFGVAVQPDLPAIALMLLSLVLLARAVEEGVSTPLLFLSALAASLGILIKLPVIVLGLPAVVIVLTRLGWRSAVKAPRLWMYAAVALLPAWGWYRYARVLQDRYGLHTFFLGKSWQQLVADWRRPSFYQSVFVQKLFDAYAFPVFALIAVVVLLVRWRSCAGWLKALAVASLLYIFLAGEHIAHHFYYGLPVVPVLALAAAIPLGAAMERLSLTPARLLVAVLLSGAVLYSWQRVGHWWPGPGDNEAYRRARAVLDHHASPDAEVMLFSNQNPTLFWTLHRKGWLAPVHDAAWLAHGMPAAPVLAIDRRVADVEHERDALLASFKAAGYAPLVSDAALDVWVRAR